MLLGLIWKRNRCIRAMDLFSCSIVEKDCNNDVLWAWTYPSISDAQKKLILCKCSFDLLHPFLYGRYKNDWFYINCTEVFESDNLPGVKQFALILWSRDFNPEKYETLSRILSKTYCKSGNPALLLKLLLSVITRGACTTEENGTYYTKDFERNSLINNTTMVGELIKLFGLQTIVIYTALLLKKRLVIYHYSLPDLLKWIRTFPALMSHRPETEMLHPWVDLETDHEHLTGSEGFVAGCGDSRILYRVDMFDVLVNLPAREITIAPHAKESLSMTKAHKEIALFLVQLADREGVTEAQIIQDVADKTQELITHLRSIADEEGSKQLTVETLRGKKFSPGVENFLLQLALSENLLE